MNKQPLQPQPKIRLNTIIIKNVTLYTKPDKKPHKKQLKGNT